MATKKTFPKKRRFRLKKDFPGFNKGDIFYKIDDGIPSERTDLIYDGCSSHGYIEDFYNDTTFNEWFEEIKPREVSIVISQNGDSEEITIKTHYSNEGIINTIENHSWLD